MATIIGRGAPTRNTPGILGQEYIDKNSGHVYKCVKVKHVTGVRTGEADALYDWVQEGTGSGQGGESDTSKKYLIPNPINTSSYSGKTIACIGDSVTAGVGANNNSYVTQIGAELNANMIHLGVSGTVLCTGGHRGCNIGKLTAANLKGADVVTILMGINDWDQSVKDGYFGGSRVYDASKTYYTLGDINSDDTTTIYGAVKMWCDRIMELKQTDSLANTKFYFMTPLISSWNNSVGQSKNWDQNKVNIHGYTLRDICQAIINVCALYEIPVIDLNLYSGIYYNSSSDQNTSTYGGDGIHPNEAGHTLIKDAVIRALGRNPEYRPESESMYYIFNQVSSLLKTELSYPAGSNITVSVIKLENIGLSQTSLSLEAGSSHTVTATLFPENTTQTNIVWESSDLSVATVKDGVVTAIKKGSATIVCRSVDNPEISASILLSVTESSSTKLTSLMISEEAVTVEANKTHTFSVSYVPSTTTQKGVVWETDDENVATVTPSADGSTCVVTATGEGQCYITVKSTENTAISDSCLFTTTAGSATSGYNVVMNANATYDAETNIIGGTSLNTTSLINAALQATALVDAPISNGMEIEVEALSKDGLAYADANKAKWSLAVLGLSRANSIQDIVMNPYSVQFPVGDANIYLDQPGSSQSYTAQLMGPTAALQKVGLGVNYPNGDTTMSVRFVFRKNTDGTVSVKIGDNDWINYSDNKTVAAFDTYNAAVAADSLYFFTSGVGLTQVKINYIGEIR